MGKIFTANCADKWLLTRVIAHVCFEMLSLMITLVAFTAGIGFFNFVNSHMPSQISCTTKLTVTLIADVRSFACVGQHVTFQVVTAMKGCVAHGAAIRSLSGMCTHVPVEQTLVEKPLVAYAADKRLLIPVPPQMGKQVIPAGIGFVAKSAAIEFHSRMGLADMLTLIVEFREVLPFAVRTFKQGIMAPLYCFAV